jgi:hypothetical protein
MGLSPPHTHTHTSRAHTDCILQVLLSVVVLLCERISHLSSFQVAHTLHAFFSNLFSLSLSFSLFQLLFCS